MLHEPLFELEVDYRGAWWGEIDPVPTGPSPEPLPDPSERRVGGVWH